MPLLSARVGRPFGRAVENLPAIDMIALFEVVDWSEDRGEVALRGMNSDPRALFYKAQWGRRRWRACGGRARTSGLQQFRVN